MAFSKPQLAAFEFVFGDGSAALIAPLNGYLIAPWPGTITGFRAVMDNFPTTVEVDILKLDLPTYLGGAPPSSILPAPIFMNGVLGMQDDVLAGWQTEFAADDVIQFSVVSTDTINILTLCLLALRTG